ncbi:methyltransferase FkbM [Leptospira kirschneri serovar Mozdok]|nr:methyltransferase FkbM [Leptospira kirschneri serovar Mozdok]
MEFFNNSISFLEGFVMDNYVVNYHHIGGRGGKFPINIPECLRDGVHLTMYDADNSCIEEAINSDFVKGFDKVEVLPFCISDIDGTEEFIITKQPHASSLLRANKELYKFVRNSPKFGAMRLKEILEPRKRFKIESMKLSSAIKKMDIPYPEFISLDTQGTEYDIIKFSSNIFQNAIFVNTEISFMEMYKSQKNFPELHNLLISLGFVLVDLKIYDPHHSCLTPIDFEAKGFLLDGEAFYLKKPEISKWSFVRLIKYCFAALISEQTHLCIQIFEQLNKKYSTEFKDLSERFEYIKLIKELCAEYLGSYKAYLPLFHESNIYKSYSQLGSVKDLSNKRKSLKINGRAMNKNRYSKILTKYGLNTFAENITNHKKLNIRSLEKIYKQ